MNTHRWAIFLMLGLAAVAGTTTAHTAGCLLYEDFESGAEHWTFSSNVENLWHISHAHAVPSVYYPGLTPFPSSVHAAWFGNPQKGSYSLDTVGVMSTMESRDSEPRAYPMSAGSGYPYGEMISPQIPCRGETILTVQFRYAYKVECHASIQSYDRMEVAVSFDDGAWATLWSRDSGDCVVKLSQPWLEAVFEVVVPSTAASMRVRFLFNAVDNIANDFLGWLVDDICVGTSLCSGFRVQGEPPAGKVDVFYTYDQIEIVGGAAPFRLRGVTKPGWMTDVSVSGRTIMLEGRPIAAGSAPLEFTVLDANDCTSLASWTVSVGADGCQSNLFFDDFERGESGWTTQGLWHRICDSVCTSPSLGYASPSCAYYYGLDDTCTYETGASNSGCLTSPVIDITSVRGEVVEVHWKYWRQTELYRSGSYDQTVVEYRINGGAWSQLWYDDSQQSHPQGGWHSVQSSLLALPENASTVQLRFCFDTVDASANRHVGWLIDDVAVVAPLEILTDCDDLVPGVIGIPYGPVPLSTVGGFGEQYVWSCEDLPPGLTCVDGVLQGTPTQTGEYSVRIVATDCRGSQDELECEISICDPLVILTSCAAFVPGKVGEEYAQVCIDVTGGCAEESPVFTWTWEPHRPAGITSQAGCITGAPAEAGTFYVTVSVAVGGQTAELGSCELTIMPEQSCDLAGIDFSNGLVGQLGGTWTVDGLWHVTDNGCAAGCAALDDEHAYYGLDATCNYNTGARTAGHLTSAEMDLDPTIGQLAVLFDHFRGVEAYFKGSFDRTFVQVRWNTGAWGAWTTVWQRDSKHPSPDCEAIAIGPINVPAGASQVQVRFGFDSVDRKFNLFIGWGVDNVQIKNHACVAALLVAPASFVSPIAAGRDEIMVLNVPNPVRDVNTTVFSVRGLEVEAMRIQIFDLNQILVFEEEIAGDQLVWHTINNYGQYLANGIYIYRAIVKQGGVWITTGFQKLVILR